MKKVMIGILVLVPIIIVLVVSLVSVFVSTRTHIGVESVVMDKQSLEIGLSDEVFDLDKLIKVTVLPDKASDKSFVWSLEEIQILDDDYKQRYEYYQANKNNEGYNGDIVASPATLVDKKGNEIDSSSEGYLKVNTYCSFYVVAQAETMSARCLVYVVGYDVEKVTVSFNSTIKVGESKLLDLTFSPVDSIVTDCVWSSDNESVLTVDKNGVITAVGDGTASVKVRAKKYESNEYVESAPLAITVNGNVTVCGEKVVLESASMSLARLGVSAADMTELVNCTVAENNIVVTNVNAPASFVIGGKTVSVVVDDGIRIGGAEVFAYDESSSDHYFLAAGNMLYLTVFKALNWTNTEISPAAVSWTSSVPAVATVNNGVVEGLKSGKTTITASFGGKTASVMIAVEQKVTTLLLDTTAGSLAVGIARETVFAAADYVEPTNPDNHALINNSVIIGFLRPFAPDDEDEAAAFYKAFNFVVTENGVVTDKAYFEGNKLVFNHEKISGKTVLNVTISAKYPKYQSNASYTTCSFDVNVIDGVEVNTYAEFRKASSDDKIVCFGNDIKFRDDTSLKCTYWGEDSIVIRKSLYGNNKKLYEGFQQLQAGAMIFVRADNVLVSNVILRTNEVGDEITNTSGAQGLTGDCISFEAENGGYDGHYHNERVEYSIFENSSSGIGIYGIDIEIEGCIIRNMQGTGVYVPTSRSGNKVRYSTVNMTNCVMSNLIGTGFSFQYYEFSNPKDEESVAFAEASVAAGKNTVFNQKGFLDIYNWQQTTVLTLISPDTVSADLYAIVQAANAYLGTVVDTNPVFEEYCSIYQGNKYFHLGFVSTGLMETSYLEFNHEDDRFMEITSDEFGFEIISCPLRIFTYGKHDEQISPSATYTVNAKLIDRLHSNN